MAWFRRKRIRLEVHLPGGDTETFALDPRDPQIWVGLRFEEGSTRLAVSNRPQPDRQPAHR